MIMTKNKPFKKDKSKKKKSESPKVNPELKGFDVSIDSLGEIKSNYNIDKINEFLNKHVDDKKLRDRDDIKEEEQENEDQDKKEEE